MVAVQYRAMHQEGVPPPKEGLGPQKEDFDRLVPQLSKQSQEVLKKAPMPGDVLRQWVRAALMSKAMPPVTNDQLTEYLKNLPVDQRQELERLGEKEMREKLTKMYYAAKFNRGPRQWPGGPGGNGPNGGWRGPDGRGPPGEGRPEGRPGEGRPGEGRGRDDGRPGVGRPRGNFNGPPNQNGPPPGPRPIPNDESQR
jgi:hypothetical protein